MHSNRFSFSCVVIIFSLVGCKIHSVLYLWLTLSQLGNEGAFLGGKLVSRHNDQKHHTERTLSNIPNRLLLAKRQRSLRTVEVGPMKEPLEPFLRKDPDMLQNLKGIRSLNLFPDAVDRLIACQILLQANPRVHSLYLASGFSYSDKDQEDIHDSSTGPGLFTKTLFSHLLPFDNCTTPLVVKDLCLAKIDLHWIADTYLKVITFSCLETLEILNCPGADNLFAAISKSRFRPANLSTLRWMHDDTNGSHSPAVFEGFLEALSNLQSLHVDANDLLSLPKVAALIRHGRTLTSLSIHSQLSGTQIHSYSIKDFEDICIGCPNIRQLAIASPTVNVEYTEMGSNFDVFLVRQLKKSYTGLRADP